MSHSPCAPKQYSLLESHFIQHGITNQQILNAFKEVPRDYFVPINLKAEAYEDRPLPIGHGQTISQPSLVAYMIDQAAVTKEDKVLDIGTGSGYQVALLSRLCKHVYSIENIATLGAQAASVLKALGYINVTCKIGDGSAGWPEHAPYDIIVAAAAPTQMPTPWLDQLAIGGRLVMPLGDFSEQKLLKITRTEERYSEEELLPVRFVPLT